VPRKRKNSTSGGLRKWFSQNSGKGWVDCKTGKPCGRKSRTAKSKRGYPACRPTMAQCKSKKAKTAIKKKTSAKRVNWKGKKNGKKSS
jgi:hypothetical protein